MLHWDDLRYFLAVARNGSLSAAARELGAQQPTVGRRISALEQRLQVTLFERHSRGYTLSEAGEKILTAATQMEQGALEVLRQVRGLDTQLSGQVRISATPGLAAWLARQMPTFNARHPGIRAVLDSENRESNLYRLEADIAIRLGRPEGDSLTARRLGELHFSLYASRAYLQRHGRPTAESLAGHSVVGYDEALENLPENRWLLARCERREPQLLSSNTTVLREAVLGGAGIGVLARGLFAADERLVALDELGRPPSREVWLVSHPGVRKQARVRALLEFIAEAFARTMQADSTDQENP